MPCLKLQLKLPKQLQCQNKTVSNEIAITMRFTQHAWASDGTLYQTVLILSALHLDRVISLQSTLPPSSPSTVVQRSSSSSSTTTGPATLDSGTTRGPFSLDFSSQPNAEDGNFESFKIVISSLGVFLVGSVIIFLLYTWKKLAPSQWR